MLCCSSGPNGVPLGNSSPPLSQPPSPREASRNTGWEARGPADGLPAPDCRLASGAGALAVERPCKASAAGCRCACGCDRLRAPSHPRGTLPHREDPWARHVRKGEPPAAVQGLLRASGRPPPPARCALGREDARRPAVPPRHHALLAYAHEAWCGAQVKLGTHILTGENVAVKVLEKARIKEIAGEKRSWRRGRRR